MVGRQAGARLDVIARSLGVLLLVTLLASCATGPVAKLECPSPPPCGENCSNQPFHLTDCWTTKYGPAKADVILASSNLLYCKGGVYALCFFSGPPTATGKQSGNPPLPCVLNGDVANCTCQVYTSGPNFVDINGILNRDAYYQTVQACGQDGSGCAHLGNCGLAGTAEGCERLKPAPVCQYIQNQNPNDASVSLIPKADLISTFSFAMHANYAYGTTPCTQSNAGTYAGCMTAPCFFPASAKLPPSDGDPIQCQCPTFTGPYQIGQRDLGQPDQVCKIPSSDGTTYVWSASHTISKPSNE